MTPTLLKIKICSPQLRRSLVPRPQLIEQLNLALQRKLTLISAPAGFGKTTLVGMWLKQASLSAAWYSLEDSDNEPLRFLDYLVTALQNIDQGLGRQTQAQLWCGQPPTFDQLLTVLLNEILEYQNEIIIVLDDFHHINSLVIQDGLDYLLKHFPPNVHLIVVTRSDPPLPISRLRSLGQLVELRAAQLRFSPQEVRHFLTRLQKLDLDPQQINMLDQRTEGWISGLQLAALSLQDRNTESAAAFITSFSGSHRFILDYLLEEVLLQETPDVQHFMLQTSILTRFNASLCDAVTGRTNSQELIESLERSNLFVFSLDNEKCWYRFHALFADLLQKHLHQLGIEEIQDLHLKASNWHQTHGSLNDAIDHALHAGSSERAVDLIELNTMNGFAQGEFYPFQYWIEKIPPTLVKERPLLCIAAAWAEIWTSSHSISRGDLWMQRANTALSTIDPDVKPAWHNLQTGGKTFNLTIRQIANSYQYAYEALSVALRSKPNQSWIDKAKDALKIIPDELQVLRGVVFAQLGITQMAIGNLQDAMKAFDKAQHLGRSGGNNYGALLATYIQAGIVRLNGELDHAESLLRQAITEQVTPMDPISRHPPIMGAIFAALGDILRERGQLDTALDFLESGLETCKPAVMGDLGIGTNQTIEEEGYVLAAVALARLKYVSDFNCQDTILEALANRCSSGLKRYVRLHQVRLWLSELGLTSGGLQKALSWTRNQELQVVNPVWDWDYEILTRLTLVRVKLAQARLDSLPGDHPQWQEILGFLEDQSKVCLDRDWIERSFEAQILKAIAYHESGKVDLALEEFGQVLLLARNKGYQRVFLDEGPQMLALLTEALKKGVAPDTVKALLSASSEKSFLYNRTVSGTANTELPLTRREIEVLKLIAAGLTNAEICRELSIAMGTVKRHAANINLKLDTHNRTQAIARARELGVLIKD